MLGLGLGLHRHRALRGGSTWALAASAAPTTHPTPNELPTSAGSGYHKVIVTTDGLSTYGDFPSATTPSEFGTVLTNVAWGNLGGTEEDIGGIWFPIVGSVPAFAGKVTVTFRTGGGVIGTPTCRIYAVKKQSPVQPAQASSDSCLHLYNTVGWTTNYTEYNPVSLTTHTLDITDIYNELSEAVGGVGTSILLAFVAQGDWTVAASWNVAPPSTLRPSITIYDFNHRDYQSTALANATAAFYWPLDAGNHAAAGNATQHRAIVAASLGGARAEVTDSTALIPATFQNLPQYFGACPLAFPSELDRGGWVRQFLGPVIDVSDPDKVNWNYGWDYNGAARDTLMVCQVVYLTGNWGCLLDVYDNTGMVQEITISNTGISFRVKWTTGPQTYTASVAIASGTVVTVAIHWDDSAGYYRCGYDVGAGFVWNTSLTDTGTVAIDTSGIQWTSGGVLKVAVQGWLMVDFSSYPTDATVNAAVAQIRELWKRGIKALPRALWA